MKRCRYKIFPGKAKYTIAYAIYSKPCKYLCEGYSTNFKEDYIRVFNTEKEAQDFLIESNKENWFRNREYKVRKINTTWKKWTPKYWREIIC